MLPLQQIHSLGVRVVCLVYVINHHTIDNHNMSNNADQ